MTSHNKWALPRAGVGSVNIGATGTLARGSAAACVGSGLGGSCGDGATMWLGGCSRPMWWVGRGRVLRAMWSSSKQRTSECFLVEAIIITDRPGPPAERLGRSMPTVHFGNGAHIGQC